MGPTSTVAVLGAGIAGLSCARALAAAGQAVVVFDKGRGPGGRASSRRAGADPAIGWDHGATGFLAEQPDFQAEVAAWAAAGVVAPWPLAPAAAGEDPRPPRAAELLAPGVSSSWVGVPSMSAVGRHLADGLHLHRGTRVERVQRVDGGWKLEAHSSVGRCAPFGPFSELVVTAPPAQTHALLAPAAPALAEQLLGVWTQPCWSLLALSERVPDPVPIRRLGPGQLPDGVATLVSEDSKPGRRPHPGGSRWLLQSTPEWARAHLEDSPETVAAPLARLLQNAIGARVLEARAHRWRYARVHRPLGCALRRDPELGLTLAGDFCLGDGVENAWLAGRAAAAALIAGS